MASPMHVRYRRRRGEPLRLLWAGRFDRQKRFDLVVAMARMRPDIEIVAYGKAVLNDFDMDEDSLPENIRLMGTYDDLEMLPFEQFDAFLYTSWWDGIPTILLDIGLTGLPIVASIVGGVGEIIDAETGWPVHDVLNPEAYLEVLEDMARDTDEILRRSANLQERLVRINDQQVYRKRLRAALAMGDD
jgi:glycosyltransferase involved in cell wall biosynthesis